MAACIEHKDRVLAEANNALRETVLKESIFFRDALRVVEIRGPGLRS